ncbi:hypothetical protein DUNSADRAFT_6922, partial [Dunaliella salina]
PACNFWKLLQPWKSLFVLHTCKSERCLQPALMAPLTKSKQGSSSWSASCGYFALSKDQGINLQSVLY